MNSLLAIFLTLALGMFILLGSIIVFVTKNSDRVVNFSISIAFGVMISLGLLELLPEAYEHMSDSLPSPTSGILLVIFTLMGIAILWGLDRFIPDHDVPSPTEKEINENLHHIGIVASIALMLHNIIEGMAIYSTVTTNSKMGLLMCIGVGLHNIPLGMVITSTFYRYNNDRKQTLWTSLVISISTFLGGIIMYLLSGFITSFVLGLLLCITLGMIIYIVIFELFPHVLEHKKDLTTILGIGLGILVLLISKLF